MNDTNTELSQYHTDLGPQISVCLVSYRPRELKTAVVTNQIGSLNKMTETNQIDE